MNQYMQIPTAYQAVHYPNQDNISAMSIDGGTASVRLRGETTPMNSFYSYNGPSQYSVANEDSRFYSKNYPVKIAQTSTGSVAELMRGDLCYSCFTDNDIKNMNDIYTFYAVSQLNQGSFRKALGVKQLEQDPNYMQNRQLRGQLPYSITNKQNGIFPLTCGEFERNWNWAGVLQQKIPDERAERPMARIGQQIYNGVFRLGSMAIADRVIIPCIVTDHVETTARIWEIAAMTGSKLNRLYDIRGRTTEALALVSSFRVFYTCTYDDLCPSFADYSTEIETMTTMEVSPVDPLTGVSAGFEPQKLEMAMMKIEMPCIRQLGYILEHEGPLPSKNQVTEALMNHAKYEDLMRMSRLTVQLTTEGWGPFNLRR